MTDIQANSPSPVPCTLFHSRDFVFRAIERIYEAADREIDDWLARLNVYLETHPDQSLDAWSIRVSKDGLEIESCPLEQWMGSDEWSTPGFYYNFHAFDTLAWLRSLIVEHRDSLGRLIVYFGMRDAGYTQTYECPAFTDAIEKKPRETIPLNFLEVDDTIPSCRCM